MSEPSGVMCAKRIFQRRLELPAYENIMCQNSSIIAPFCENVGMN